MHVRNRQDQIMVSIKHKNLPKLKRFLKTLKVSSESRDMVECFLKHPKCTWELPHHMEVFVIDSDHHEHLVIIVGKSQIHLLITKNKAGQKLMGRLLAFIPFPKFKPRKEGERVKKLSRRK